MAYVHFKKVYSSNQIKEQCCKVMMMMMMAYNVVNSEGMSSTSIKTLFTFRVCS